jgi:hypothetical protein
MVIVVDLDTLQQRLLTLVFSERGGGGITKSRPKSSRPPPVAAAVGCRPYCTPSLACMEVLYHGMEKKKRAVTTHLPSSLSLAAGGADRRRTDISFLL